ncbi:MAG TPA: hypothetical protein VEC36_11050 [Patescibacteria group bacterium]|nr:hypothetical protein [Patescibacteria group bacterium]
MYNYLFLTLFLFCLINSTALSQELRWIWAKSPERSHPEALDERQSGHQIVVDSKGTVFITGEQKFLLRPYTDTYWQVRPFLSRYDSKGATLLVHFYDDYDTNYTRLRIDGSDNLYMAGTYKGYIHLANKTLSGSSTSSSGFVYAIKPAATEVYWAKATVGKNNVRIHDVAVDRNRNVCITGTFLQPYISLEKDTLYSKGNNDFFIAKYNSLGDLLWARSAGEDDAENGICITADPSGNIYVAGTFYSDSIAFGEITLTHRDRNDIFLVKYNPNGNILWAKTIGTFGMDRLSGLYTDKRGNIILLGNFLAPSITLGGFLLINSNPGTNDVFLFRIDSDGNVLNGLALGGTNDDIVTSLAEDRFGNLFLGGYFKSPYLTVGTNTVLNAGSSDIFIAKIDTNGLFSWVRSAGGQEEEKCNGIGVDTLDGIYITGSFKSSELNFGERTLKRKGSEAMFIAKLDMETTSTIETVEHNPEKIMHAVQGRIFIPYSTFGNRIIQIYSLTGEMLQENHMNEYEEFLPISGLIRGQYFYRISGNGFNTRTGVILIE